MILECPSCHARYLVQIGLFAQGGRQVRCARCKHTWHASLPNTIDVVKTLPDMEPSPAPDEAPHAAAPEAASGPSSAESRPKRGANLPAVIKEKGWRHHIRAIVAGGIAVILLGAWPILGRQQIVQVVPQLRGFYEALGLSISHTGNGLEFEQVKSELRYDSGTMRLFVDGIIHNTTSEAQLIPDIKARALGPDQHIIQSWWVEAPAATVAAGSDVPFHTEVNAPMKRTIENIYLEFYSRDEKDDVAQ